MNSFVLTTSVRKVVRALRCKHIEEVPDTKYCIKIHTHYIIIIANQHHLLVCVLLQQLPCINNNPCACVVRIRSQIDHDHTSTYATFFIVLVLLSLCIALLIYVRKLEFVRAVMFFLTLLTFSKSTKFLCVSIQQGNLLPKN